MPHLNSLFRSPISKYSHTLRSWGSGLRHVNLGGRTSAPESPAWEACLDSTHDKPAAL